MDLSDYGGTEMCWSPKKLKNCEENKDFISDLPDSILMHILSFLPQKDAINTVLLRRFCNLWHTIPVLVLNECLYHDHDGSCESDDDYEGENYDNSKFLNKIRRVSCLPYCGPLEKLSLKLWSPTYSDDDPFAEDPDFENRVIWDEAAADMVEKLVCYAMRRRVKVLDLNFRACPFRMHMNFFKLPDVLNSHCLIDLRLTVCDIRGCQDINLKALKILFLRNVSLSDEAMEKVFLGCPFLEDLSVSDCYGLRKLKCTNSRLKKVMLSLDVDGELVDISFPHVKSLEIKGWIERANLLDVSSLVDASIWFSYCFRCAERSYDQVQKLMLKIRKCKTFTPCLWSILVLTIWNLKNVPCPYFEWSNLVLELGLTKWHHPGLSLLLRRSPYLETLTVKCVYSGWEPIYKTEQGQWIWEHDFDLESYWDSQEATFPFLETVMICGYIDKPHLMKMVKFLMKNAPRLQKMEISTTCSVPKRNFKLTSGQMLEIAQELLKFPRASPQAMICFS